MLSSSIQKCSKNCLSWSNIETKNLDKYKVSKFSVENIYIIQFNVA
jgi:hypothetical protein